MSFIDDDEVEFFLAFVLVSSFEYFVETSVGDELSVFLDTKSFEFIFPCLV